MTNTPDPDRRPSNFPPPVADDTFGPPERPAPRPAGETRRAAKSSAVGTLVALGIVAVLAAIIVPIVMHMQGQAEAEQRHRDRVNEITEDLLNRE